MKKICSNYATLSSPNIEVKSSRKSKKILVSVNVNTLLASTRFYRPPIYIFWMLKLRRHFVIKRKANILIYVSQN